MKLASDDDGRRAVKKRMITSVYHASVHYSREVAITVSGSDPRLKRRGACPRTPARGKGAGGLECLWRRSARCSRARRTCRSAAGRARMTAMALAMTFAQPVEPAEVEEVDEEEQFGRYTGSSSSGGWMR
jgi:hypothetical protein